MWFAHGQRINRHRDDVSDVARPSVSKRDLSRYAPVARCALNRVRDAAIGVLTGTWVSSVTSIASSRHEAVGSGFTDDIHGEIFVAGVLHGELEICWHEDSNVFVKRCGLLPAVISPLPPTM